jgi:hypothetical protein
MDLIVLVIAFVNEMVEPLQALDTESKVLARHSSVRDSSCK